MPATHVLVGANTSSGAVVTAKVSSPSTILVSTSPTMSGAVSFGPVSPSNVGRARFVIDGLEPNQQHYYQIHVGTEFEGHFQGQFRTTPIANQPANWTVAAASCAGTGSEYPGVGDVLNPARLSNHPVFNVISTSNPDQFIHIGDVLYYDPGSGVHVPTPTTSEAWETLYRRSWDDVLTQPNQQLLYSNVATPYFYDDHDFGPNDSDGSSAGRDYVTRAYRDYWPHYPLPAGSGSNPIYQSWMMGRVLWMALDVRADRSPNASPDVEEKTMLGDAQLSWIRATLASTQAQALVLVSGSQWIRNGADTWSRFEYDRRRLLDILEETNFLHRMIIVSGDTHELAIDTGTNSQGNIPVFQFASLDSNHSDTPSNIYDTGPSRPGRGQWGRISCVDNGTTITLTGECMVMDRVWRSHPVSITVDDYEIPPGDVIPAPVPSAQSTGYRWYSCSATTGNLIDELPEVVAPELSLVIGDHTSSGLNIPMPLSDKDISRERVAIALAEKRSVIVAEVNETPVWSGWVLNSDVGTDPMASAGCVTPEAYLSGRFIQKDYDFVNRDFAEVIRVLIAENCGPIKGMGQGFHFLVDAPPTGYKVTVSYEANSHKSVRQALDELMAMENGPEWTVRTVWRDIRRQAVDWIIEVRPEVGRVSDTPEHLWEITRQAAFESRSKSDASYTLSTTNSGGKGANVTVAYSSGEGDSRPQSDYQIATDVLRDTGIPIIEDHWQPANDIPDKATLNSYAKERLELTKHGIKNLDLTARFDEYPRLGIDWALGDTVAWVLHGHGHPTGYTGRGRVMRYTLNPQMGTVKPYLWNPGDDL